jgi:hypothetical protein
MEKRKIEKAEYSPLFFSTMLDKADRYYEK